MLIDLQSGPGPTYAARHVAKINYGKIVVVRLLAADADAVAAATRSNIGVVDAHVDGTIAVGADVPIALSGVLVYVRDIAMGRIRPSEKVPIAEEAVLQVVV